MRRSSTSGWSWRSWRRRRPTRRSGPRTSRTTRSRSSYSPAPAAGHPRALSGPSMRTGSVLHGLRWRFDWRPPADRLVRAWHIVDATFRDQETELDPGVQALPGVACAACLDWPWHVGPYCLELPSALAVPVVRIARGGGLVLVVFSRILVVIG